MTEKEIINKIKELKEIKPQKDWVCLTKSKILGQETVKSNFSINIFPLFKPALATLTVLVIFFGLFGFAQTSVPGDFLYSVKKMAEKGQTVFIPEDARLENSLKLADKRLEELTRIVESNHVKSLPQAINEVQASVSEAAKNISKMGATSSNSLLIKEIVDKTKELEFKIEGIRSLGVVIDNDELQEVSANLEVKILLTELESKVLTEEQKQILEQMKELAENKEYSKVLEMFFLEFDENQEIGENNENTNQENIPKLEEKTEGELEKELTE